MHIKNHINCFEMYDHYDCFSAITGFYIDLTQLIAVVTVWQMVYLFYQNLQLDIVMSEMNAEQNDYQRLSCKGQRFIQFYKHRLTWTEINNIYQTIKGLCKAVNDAFGDMTTIISASSIMFQSVYMDRVFTSGNYRVLLFFFTNIATFLLAADIVHRVSFIN